MSKFMIGVIVVVVLAVGALVLMPKAGKTASDPSLTFATVQQDIKGGAKFYDVRTPQEFATNRFEGTANWPLQEMQAGRLPDVAKDTKIYLHCQSGNRSAQATRILKNAGYTNVIDLGGINHVQSIGGKATS